MKDYVKVNKEVYDSLAKEYKQKTKGHIISERKIASPFIDYLKKHFQYGFWFNSTSN